MEGGTIIKRRMTVMYILMTDRCYYILNQEELDTSDGNTKTVV